MMYSVLFVGLSAIACHGAILVISLRLHDFENGIIAYHNADRTVHPYETTHAFPYPNATATILDPSFLRHACSCASSNPFT
jgi:hypothetical protein